MTGLEKWMPQLPHGFDPNLGPGWTGLWIRPNTSDVDVLHEVWVLDMYHLRGLDLRRYGDDVPVPRIIDIGACTGLFSALCARAWPDAQILAVEPDLENYGILTLNLAQWNHRATPTRLAVGAASGVATLHGMHGTGHTVPGDQGGETVTQATLESLINGRPVSLLKVDIEGGEYDALMACPRDALRLVDRIVMEWHGTAEAPWIDDAPARYGELLTHLAYTHSVTVYGTPDAGGYLYAHRNDL